MMKETNRFYVWLIAAIFSPFIIASILLIIAPHPGTTPSLIWATT